ncbi:MAG: hypothetical protein NZM42_03585 [Gemmatales bacterium]|nr:hypothetical protein [Gemmatales bacterium]MDW8222514.1 hypothetical protein [Gemmatales bacterium]
MFMGLLASVWVGAVQSVAQEPVRDVPTVYRLVLPAQVEKPFVELGPPVRGSPPGFQDSRQSEARPGSLPVVRTGDNSGIQPTLVPPHGFELAPLPTHLVPEPRPQAAGAAGQVAPLTKPMGPPIAAYVEPLEVPTPERLFRLESERELRERLRQEQRDQGARATFPADVAVAPPGVTYQGRAWPRFVNTIPTSVTAYQPLYFEDKNVERYGWDAGIFQPLLSAGKFYLDVALLPYHVGTQWPWSLEYNAGYSLPGDPEPYRLYCPRLSCTGAALESLAVLGIIALP